MTDVQLFVDQFYTKVRADNLIGPIFSARLEGRWPEHLQKMYRFRQTILLPEHTYNGYPFRPHANLIVGKQHFERWLGLFYETLDTYFEGEQVEAAKRQASKMAQLFQMRLAQIQEHKG